MQHDVWMMSTRLAWHRPWFRALFLLLLVCVVLVNGVFLMGILPVVRETKTVILHMNVYTGIDDIRPWTWVFLWPALWTGSVLVGVGAAFTLFQRDMMLAYGVLLWLVAWSFPWVIGFFYLLTLNLSS